MLGFAGWYDNQPYRDILFFTPFQHVLFIKPTIYWYTQSLLNADFRFSKKISAFYFRNDNKAFLWVSIFYLVLGSGRFGIDSLLTRKKS
jgi:hypothetical protein